MKEISRKNMSVRELTPANFEKLREDWSRRGVSESVLQEFLNYQDASKITCHCVEENGTILAIFEKRDALRSYKNMSILFSPAFKVSEGDFEEVSEELDTIIAIIGKIFLHFINEPLAERGQIKIYNDQPYVTAVLIDMGKYIQKTYPHKYEVKLYRNWIDIKLIKEEKNA